MKKSGQTTFVNDIFMFHQGIQSNGDQIFKKLNTEVEILEIQGQIIEENIRGTFSEDRKLTEMVQHWFINQSERLYTVVKIQDNSPALRNFTALLRTPNSPNLLYLKSLINDFNAIIIQLSQGSECNLVIYKDPLHPDRQITLLKENQCSEGLLLYIVPQVKDTNIIGICRTFNALNIANSVTLKYLKISDIRHLQNMCIQFPLLEQSIINVFQFNTLVTWEQPEDLEILFQCLSANEKYNEQHQEYRTSIEYFSEPDINEKAQVIRNLFQGDGVCVLQSNTNQRSQISLIVVYREDLRENQIVIKSNEAVVPYSLYSTKFNELLRNLLKKHCYYIIQIKSQYNLRYQFDDLVEFIETNKHEIKKPKYQQNQQSQSDQQHIQNCSNLFISIQQKSNEKLQFLNESQWQTIKSNLKRIMIKQFMINKV